MYSLSLPFNTSHWSDSISGGRGVSLLFFGGFVFSEAVWFLKDNLRLISVVHAVYQCGIFLCVCVLKRIRPHALAVEILWSALANEC